MIARSIDVTIRGIKSMLMIGSRWDNVARNIKLDVSSFDGSFDLKVF